MNYHYIQLVYKKISVVVSSKYIQMYVWCSSVQIEDVIQLKCTTQCFQGETVFLHLSETSCFSRNVV